jgi:predicted dehydrogenase
VTTTKIAVIGCGHWGPHHVRIFNTLPESDVVAVADPDENRLAQLHNTWPGIRSTTDAAEAMAAADAVVIATPTATHYALARQALTLGKHVLCEKPLCERASEAEALVALAAERGLTLMVGHVFLFNPGVVKLKELLASGDIGRLCYLSAVRTNLGPIRRDVNVAYDLAAHDVSIFNWLIGGEPESVSATGGVFLQPGVEDVAFISLRYGGNRLANVLASWLNPKKVRQLTMVGTEKMVTWDDIELQTPVAIYDRGAKATPEPSDFGEFLRIAMWNADVRLPPVQPAEPLRVQDDAFLKKIREGGTDADRSTGAFSVGVVRTLEAIRTSLKAGGGPVSLAS